MSARGDYQYGERGAQHYTMCDEIDRLRAALRWVLTEMPVGWELIASSEGRDDVVATVQEIATRP